MNIAPLSSRAVASGCQRATWLVLAVVLAFNFDCSFILETRTASLATCWDPELAGCFQHIDGRESGLMIVTQEDCNVIHGSARGLSELGPPANDVWVFDGWLEGEEGELEEGVAGMANIEASWDGATGVQTLRAIHRDSSDSGEERLTLTHQGTAMQVELVRCAP